MRVSPHQWRSCRAIAWVAAGILIAGCSTRSISNPNYRGGWNHGSSLYAGELHEYNVLGLDPSVATSGTSIVRTLKEHAPIVIPPQSRVLLIQSGALLPDEPMQRALSERYEVLPFSGIPQRSDSAADYASALRLAAAKGGCRYIMCYWGVIETSESNLATKAVSWAPIVGQAIPDKTQHMRIRLKIIAIEVETGRWDMLTPETVMDRDMSARANRRSADQAQVAKLKEESYTGAARAVFTAW